MPRLSPDRGGDATASTAHLPISTLLRLWALERLHTEEQCVGAGSVAERLARLEQEVFRSSA